MNWLSQNRWLGTFLIILGVVTLAALYFLFSAKSRATGALARFQEAASEKNRLERLDPYPSEPNVRKMKLHLENYTAALGKLEEELKNRVPNPPPLAPNEFQARLRQSILQVTERARAKQVKLPDGFALGFEEYTAALPTTSGAPLLGQELTQVESLLNLIIDAIGSAGQRAELSNGISAFSRKPLPDERGGAATPNPSPAGRAPSAGSDIVERGVVDVTFSCASSSGRKVLNQVVSSPQQFYVLRALHVRNEKDKGPAREQPAQAGQAASAAAVSASTSTQPTSAKAPATGALNFIVGNEHIEISSRIEMLRFKF